MPEPRKFEVIEEDSELPRNTLDLLLEGVKALPRKTANVLAACFALITVVSVFWLSLLIVPYEPTLYQLIGLAGYGVFVIAINVINRRK